MFRYITLMVIAVFFFMNAAYGEIKLFLRPKVIAVNDLLLSDIASVEAGQANADNINKIIIESSAYSDGYIEKRELASLLKRYTDENIIIYGNAVKVFIDGQHSELIPDIQQNQINDFILRKGDRVDIVVKKNGISILLKGTAVNEGKINDEVSIKLEDKSGILSKLVKGKVKSRDLVEINI